MSLLSALLGGLALAATDDFGDCVELGPLFEDVTAEAGVRAHGNSLGVTLNDLDGDGDPDILVNVGPARVEHGLYYSSESLLYLNEGGLRFTEAGADWGVDDLCEDRAPLYGDLDNDGLPDLYITVNGQNLLLRNDGFGGYVDVTAEAGAAGHRGWGHEGVLLDVDRDGFLDVFFTNGPEDGSGPNVLLHNEADGTFSDVTARAGLGGPPTGKGACSLDADLDGWMDLFVTTGVEDGNQLWMNQGDGTFLDEAAAWGVSDPERRFGVGVVCEDLTNDGQPDIALVTHDKRWTGNQLFINEGGSFSEQSAAWGFQDWVDPHGLAAVDVDNDGWMDLVLSGIGLPPFLLRNTGEGSFERLCDGAGLVLSDGVAWAAVAGDLDEDGYPEVYLSHGLGRRPRGDALYRNLGGDHHWLTVEVVGVTHNPSALGAKVQVTAGGLTRTRWVGTWSSFDSQGPLPLTFGLGDSAVVDELRVTFTDGGVQLLEALPADTKVVVVEEAEQREDDDADGVPDPWDACPGTHLGRRTDREGCATGQRGGLPIALVEPAQDAVVTEAPRFTWSQGFDQAVVQISTDGSFGPAGRFDLGPATEGLRVPSGEEWAAILDAAEGSGPLLWRVAAVGDDGAQTITPPRRLHLARDTAVVRVPRGANVFEPAHVSVEVGEPVTWWNDSVSGGNLQAEPHDVQLIDDSGDVLSVMEELSAGGAFTWSFEQPGLYHVVCQRHSGTGGEGDHTLETTTYHRGDGPYRCMAGTISVTEGAAP